MRRVSSKDRIPKGLLGCAVVSGLAAAATLGGVGTANASCLSVSGINIFGSECTSSPLSFAFALGPNRAAIAEGLFTGAIAIGTNNIATAEGFLTGAIAIGLDSTTHGTTPRPKPTRRGHSSLAYAGGTHALGAGIRQPRYRRGARR